MVFEKYQKIKFYFTKPLIKFFRSFTNIFHLQYDEAIMVFKMCFNIVNVNFGEYIVTAQLEGVNFTLVVTK